LNSRSTKELILANEKLLLESRERQRSQAALEQSERKYRELVENANSIILRVDEGGEITFFNEFAEKFFGITEAEILGKNLFGTVIAVKGGSEEQKGALIREFLKPTEYLIFNETECLRKNGEPAWVAWTNRAVVDAQGMVREFLIVGMDITERKQVENALYQVNTKLNVVSSIARHDILNKLTIISSTLSLLDDNITDPKLTEFLKQAQAATLAITRQMEFTRDYKNMGMEKAEWQNVEHTIHKVVDNNYGSGIQFDLRLDGLEIFADSWLKKAIFNMTDAIIRQGLRTKTIHVSYQESDEGLDLFFEGDAKGIPAEDKEKIFVHGFGNTDALGLFLVREILAITGIAIKETGDPEKMVRFDIRLPKRGFRWREKNS
jgi:PAS domain S-box-containing protein